LSAIAERRSDSGEDSEDEDEGGWKRTDVRSPPVSHPTDESVLKAGYLWKKGKRRKVTHCLFLLSGINHLLFRRGRNVGSSFGPLIWRTTKLRKNINYSVFWN